MVLTLSGQKPAVLDPVHTIPLRGDYDPVPAIKQAIVDPVFQPMRPGGAVTLVNGNGKQVDDAKVLDLVLSAVGPSLNTSAEQKLKGLYQQALVHYDQTNPMLFNEVYAVQAGHRAKFPPKTSARVIYTAGTDVIPAAKQLLGGGDGGDFFASIAYTYAPEALGFWFKTAQDYDDFTTWLTQQISVMANVLPGDTVRLLTRLSQTKLKMVEGYVLRKDDDDELQDYSFARTIVHLLMQYQQQNPSAGSPNPNVGVMPFVVSELFLPRTIVFVNAEAHARATPKKVDMEWRLIQASIKSPIKVISNKQLSNLTALPRARAKAAAKAANAQSNKGKPAGRSAKIVFRKQPPNRVDIEKGLLRVLKRMKEVARSQNSFKKVKTSFAKANRRDPMDYNRPGKITSTRYLPDLHVYIDTSGSISEDNYQQAVLMLIKLAKKLNVNLYFNSFSHVLSQEVMLKTKDKSVKQIWEEFRRVPKVNGGTDYRQIWNYIQASPKRQSRLSLVVTDFEWGPGTQRDEHPVNLYYAPCGNMDWQSMTNSAEHFVRSMSHIEPAIAQRLIGIVA